MLICQVVSVSTALYAACPQNSGLHFHVWLGNVYESMGLYTCVPCFISYLDRWLHANSANCTFQRPSSKRKASCPSDRGRLTVLEWTHQRHLGSLRSQGGDKNGDDVSPGSVPSEGGYHCVLGSPCHTGKAAYMCDCV